MEEHYVSDRGWFRRAATMQEPQEEIRRALGFWEVLLNYAGISGMRSPVPGWFLRLPKPVQKLSRALFAICELSLIFLALSAIRCITDECESSTRVECIGSLILLISAFWKYTLLNKHHSDYEKSIADLHDVAQRLLYNPVGDRTYLELHHNKTRTVHLYTKLRYSSLVGLCCALMSAVLFQGLVWPSVDQRLPMSGWFPIDRSNRLHFLLACFAQFEYYLLISLRDTYCDAAVHFPLAAVNVQLVYLRRLLDQIVREGNRDLIKWWLVQHQDVLRNLSQFMTIAGPQMTILNSASALQLFMYLFRLTEEENIMVTKEVALATVCSFMLLHVYVASYVGDEIAENSTLITNALDNQQFWDMPRHDIKILHHVVIRCSRPSVLRFAKIFPLRVDTFGTIVYKMIGFFNTIYQVRNG